MVMKRQSVNVQDNGPTKRRKEEVQKETPPSVLKSASETLVELPKKPAQPKQLFLINIMEKLKNKPDFDKKKVITDAKLQWHGLSDKERQKWVDQALEEENKYIEKLKLFKADNPDVKRLILGAIESVTNKRASKNLRLAGLPKKPIPAKQMYVEDRLEQLEKEPNFNKKKARVQASHQWDSLSDPERQMWTKRAAEEGKKYNRMLKLFKADNSEIQLPKTKTTKEDVKKGSAGKPVKPPKTGYSLYFKTMLEKLSDLRSLEPKDQMKEILTRWNKIPESEKEKYRTKVKNYKCK